MAKNRAEIEAQERAYDEFVSKFADDFISKNHLTRDYFLQVQGGQVANSFDLRIQIVIWGITVEEFIEIHNDNTLQITLAWEWESGEDWGFVPAMEGGDEYPTFYLYIADESVKYLENKYPKLAEGSRREELIEDFANNLFVLKFALERRINNSIFIGDDKYTYCYNILMYGFKKWVRDNFLEWDDTRYSSDLDNEEIENQQNPEDFHQLRTTKATTTRIASQIVCWKDAFFPAMIRIYSAMDKDKMYTKKEVARLFENEGLQIKANKRGIITDTKIDYFWRMFTSGGRPLENLSTFGSIGQRDNDVN